MGKTYDLQVKLLRGNAVLPAQEVQEQLAMIFVRPATA